MGRRFVVGAGQLFLALGGFVMMVVWLVRFYYDRYREIIGEAPDAGPYGWWGKWGAILFGAGWLWALFTSLSLLRQARRAPPTTGQPAPPRIAPPAAEACKR